MARRERGPAGAQTPFRRALVDNAARVVEAFPTPAGRVWLAGFE
jgi:hypothetical protein